MITLYTPVTGFPDLEAKIAYGLARVGIEAYGSEKVTIKPRAGYYIVEIEADIEKLNTTFKFLCDRLLQSEYIFLNTPGIKRSGKPGEKGWNLLAREDESYQLNKYLRFSFSLKNKKEEPICNHEGNKIGVQIGFSAEASYHQSRDKIDIQKDKRGTHRPTNPKKLCKTCGLLAALGMWFASFIFSIKEKEVIVIPIPKVEAVGRDIEKIFSLQHYLRRDYLCRNQKKEPIDIPSTLIPFVFLSKIPSTVEILKNFELFIALLSRQAQVYHVDGISLIPIEDYLQFLENPYNTASVDKMLQKEAFGALQELNKFIHYKNLSSLLSFPRLYVQETSKNKETSKDKYVNLLYPETSNYLLEKVAMIREGIIENKGVRSLADTLSYFVWSKHNKNYSYADNIRNARTHEELRNIIARMLREAKLRYDQEHDKKDGEYVNIPSTSDIDEFNKWSNEAFEEVKATLFILAFTWHSYKKKEEEMQNA